MKNAVTEAGIWRLFTYHIRFSLIPNQKYFWNLCIPIWNLYVYKHTLKKEQNEFFLPLFWNIINMCVLCLVTQSCLTLCDPVDCSPPGSSVHGVFQARVLECFAISFSGGSSYPRDRTQVSCIAGRFYTIWATREAHSQMSVHLRKIRTRPSRTVLYQLSTSLKWERFWITKKEMEYYWALKTKLIHLQSQVK